MTFLIDTHCWLWWLTEPERLRGDSVALLENADTKVVLSTVTSWEIAIKYSIGRLQLPEPPEIFVPARIERDRLTTLPVHHAHALKTANLPFHHKDPFDRLLVAQCLVERLPIMTADPSFEPYRVEVIPA